MEYKIRKSTIEDCEDVCRVVTIAWNETYKGIVPDYFLKELKDNEQERIQNSIKKFKQSKNKKLVLEVNGRVVGFANYGKSEDEEYNQCGEIFALYIIKEYKGKGFGKKLVESAKKDLKNMGYSNMIISCLKGNESNEFYKHIGGKYIKDRIFKKLNLPENVYYFENI